MFSSENSFWNSALSWRDSVSPKIIGRVLFFVAASAGTTILCQYYEALHWPVGPLEVSGAILGLILIIRTNAGYDRWWEARKLWGGIVNQSRNLAIAGLNFGVSDLHWQNQFLNLVKQFPEEAAKVLRGEAPYNTALLASNQIAMLTGQAFRRGLISGFELDAIESQRAQLIDHLGGCERILKTPLPRVLDIKVRRFIMIFLFLVPLSLTHKMGWLTPAIMLVLSYSLLALDQIGIELQNPFARINLSSLPLDQITDGIQNTVDKLSQQSEFPLQQKTFRDPVPLDL